METARRAGTSTTPSNTTPARCGAHLPAAVVSARAGAAAVAAGAPGRSSWRWRSTSCAPRRRGTWPCSCARGRRPQLGLPRLPGARGAASRAGEEPRGREARRLLSASGSTACRRRCGACGTTRRTTATPASRSPTPTATARSASGRRAPSCARSRRSRRARGYKRSAAFLFVWFSIHSFLVLVFHSQRNDYYARVSRRVVYTESAAMLAFWVGVLAAGRAVRLPVHLRAARAGRQRGGHVVHRHQPLPEPAHRGQRPAGQHAVGHQPALVGDAAPAVRLPRRAPSLPDDERPARAGGARRAACVSTAIATCACRTPARCGCSTRARSCTRRTTR